MALGFLFDMGKDRARIATSDGRMIGVPRSQIPKGLQPGMDVNWAPSGSSISITPVAPPAATSQERTASKNPNAPKLRGARARQQYVFQKMVGHGWTPPQASGIVGRLMQESGDGLNTRALGDKQIPGGSFGIGQWNRERKAALWAFQTGTAPAGPFKNHPLVVAAAKASQGGRDPGDLDGQVDFWNWEIRNSPSERIALAALQRADTSEESSIAMMHYERPKGYTPRNPTGGHGYGNTVRNANAVLGTYDPSQVVALSDTSSHTGDPDAPGFGMDPSLETTIDSFGDDAADSSTDPKTFGDLGFEPPDFSSLTELDLMDENRIAARREENALMQQGGMEAVSGSLPRLPTFGDLFAENKF